MFPDKLGIRIVDFKQQFEEVYKEYLIKRIQNLHLRNERFLCLLSVRTPIVLRRTFQRIVSRSFTINRSGLPLILQKGRYDILSEMHSSLIVLRWETHFRLIDSSQTLSLNSSICFGLPFVLLEKRIKTSKFAQRSAHVRFIGAVYDCNWNPNIIYLIDIKIFSYRSRYN